MAIADLDELKRLVASPPFMAWNETTLATTSAQAEFVPWMSSWTGNFGPLGAGATPTTSVALSGTSAGAAYMPYASSGNSYIVESRDDTMGVNTTRTHHSLRLIIDRLVHQGGLVGNTTGVQTTNLPTAALTRYTSGVGVQMAFEVYTSWGAGSTTVSVSYTNSAGTPGQIGTYAHVGALGVKGFVMIPLAAGDLGVKSVESVTLSGALGTAGNMGIVLFKPLAYIDVTGHRPPQNATHGIWGWNTPIESSPCLQFLLNPSDWNSGNTHGMNLGLAEV
jgi:hypothetical protein